MMEQIILKMRPTLKALDNKVSFRVNGPGKDVNTE